MVASREYEHWINATMQTAATARCSPAQDIVADLKARLPFYWIDWIATEPKGQGASCTVAGVVKIVSASVFSYISSVLPAVVIGDLLYSNTDGQLGLSEVLLSTGFIGVLWALIGGQPLCIIGVTMPVAIFTSVCYILAEQLEVPFLPWLGWVCIFSGLMHIALAALGAVRFVQATTAFSCEIFGFFISVTYIYDAAVDVLDPLLMGLGIQEVPIFWTLGSSENTRLETYTVQVRGSAFANLCIAAGTFSMCMSLHHAQQWRLFVPCVRTLLADYAAPLALVVFTALSFLPEVDAAVGDGRLIVPDSTGLVPSFNRSWIVPLYPGSVDPAADLFVNATASPRVLASWHVALALVPAIMLTALFFFDHNVSSKLAQDPKFHLRKPSAYHWDFSVLGLEVLLVGLVGLPPGNGLIPQAPLHTRALSTIELRNGANGPQETYTKVVETRWSNLLQSVGVFCTVFAMPALATVPQGSLSGVFLFLGVAGFEGNELWERSILMLTQPSLRPQDLRYMPANGVPFLKVQIYTLVQLAFVACVFVLAKMPYVAVAFPLLIAVLIPFRIYLLPCIFTDAELDALDPPASPPETGLDAHDPPDPSDGEHPPPQRPSTGAKGEGGEQPAEPLPIPSTANSLEGGSPLSGASAGESTPVWLRTAASRLTDSSTAAGSPSQRV